MAKKFTKPEDIKALDEKALSESQDAALDRYSELAKIADDVITDEELDEMEGLKAFIVEVKAERVEREEAATARAERIAAAKELPEDEDESDAEGEDDSEDEAREEAEENDAEAKDAADAEERESIAASAGKPRVSSIRKTLRKKTPVADEEDTKPKVTITAQADVSGFASGQELDGMKQATAAFMARLKGFPARKPGKGMSLKHGVANIGLPAEPNFAEFSVDTHSSNEQMWETIMKASREDRLQGNSLVAAGGWCAPSVPLFDLCQWETSTGGLDLPEITITRGGINFTKGPDFSTIFDNTGFLQSEDDAIAGEVKTFLEVECPDWEEVRLDAIGYGVKAPILTGSPAGYPELINRYLQGALVAHWHHKNAYKINKVLGYLGAGVNFGELGAGTSDVLYAIEVAAQSLRYKFRLGENATMEAMFPMWIKSAIRADLANRTGVDMLGVTDAQIQTWFTMRGIRPQYVYDWAGQDLSGSATAFPTSVKFGIWPAGTFVAGTNSVISLDAIYDSTEIETNVYTAAFFEEAILVANTCGNGRLFDVGLNYFGRTGAAQLGGLANS